MAFSYSITTIMHRLKFAVLFSVLALSACQENKSNARSPILSASMIELAKHGSIEQLQAAMIAGEITGIQLTDYFLQQINLKNPTLNAVLSINPNAREQAKQLDYERSQGKSRGPLHGIPILVKDNIDVEGIATTAGSLLLKGNIAAQDAPSISRLKQAGVIILGKANLSEWANFRSQRSSSGWSALAGQTRNPHDITRSPCGSSSGSGASVAAGLAVAALGTETNGSVVCPAAMNGVVGIKPSLGLVSRSGVVPIAHSQDTIGPMTRYVADAALLLSTMSGFDEKR